MRTRRGRRAPPLVGVSDPPPSRSCACASRVGTMGAARLAGALCQLPASGWRATKSPLWRHSLQKISSQGGKPEPVKQPLKKPKLPLGRFDEPEDLHVEKEPLKKFPDDFNPVTKEKGGPRGPEPTRYGDWERKGRCIDF